MKWFKEFSLQKKVLATYVALVLVPLTFLFFLFIFKVEKDETRRHAELLGQASESISGKLTNVMEEIRYTSSMYIVNEDIVAALENDFYIGQSGYLQALRTLRLNAISIRVNPNLSSITYITISGQVYSGAGYNPEYIGFLQEMIVEMQQSGAKSMLTPVYEAVVNHQNVKTITFAYTVAGTYSFDVAGYAFVNVDLKKIEKNFEVFTENGAVASMAVQDGGVVYSAKAMDSETAKEIAQAARQHEKEIYSGETLVFYAGPTGGEVLCAATYCEALDMLVVSSVPTDTVNVQMYSGIQFYLVTVVSMALVFVAISIILSMQMTRPVRVLSAGMQKVEQGHLETIREQTERQDDMGKLIQGFNRMVTRLKESILREYESKDLQRKAQIKMLQSQINPHFLYNALNVISSIAELENVPDISRIANNLAGMFRYNISRSSVVTLQEEVTQIKRYADIQKMCMAGEVQMEYNISSEAENCRVLKFLLQPLVENSLVHGFEGTTRKGKIVISAHVERGVLRLAVRDTGRGIPPDRLQELTTQCANLASLYTEEQKRDNIGILNVNFRLKSYYGEQYGLAIESGQEQGTVISMNIPCESEGAL